MKINDFIVCEDIRQEIGGKVSLIGVYGDNIKFDGIPQSIEWPIITRISIYTRLGIEQGDNIPSAFSLKLLFNETQEIARIDGELILKQGVPPEATGRPHLIALPFVTQIPIPGPGILSMELNITSNDQIVFTANRTINIDCSFQGQ